MQHPGPQHPAVARCDRPQIAPQESQIADQWPQQQTAGEGVVRPQYPLPPSRQSHPDRRVEIVRFGIVIGIGQDRVVVMRKMGVEKPQIGIEKADRQEDQQMVQRGIAQGMAMQRLVLQRGMLGDGNGRCRHGQNRRPGPEHRRPQREKRIGRGQQGEGRPFGHRRGRFDAQGGPSVRGGFMPEISLAATGGNSEVNRRKSNIDDFSLQVTSFRTTPIKHRSTSATVPRCSACA
jgi:hypothetical protein